MIENSACISTQVLGEFVNVCQRKHLLGDKEVAAFVKEFTLTLSVSSVTLETFRKALHTRQRYQIHFYDALIVSSALESGADVLYTEDLQHKQKIDSLTIINPFI